MSISSNYTRIRGEIPDDVTIWSESERQYSEKESTGRKNAKTDFI